ncbi:MAG TPA: hypothetical protein DDW23_08700 [Planctomycetes bacterium]|nr:hypothetical protein [Planctomycetota bacterium]
METMPPVSGKRLVTALCLGAVPAVMAFAVQASAFKGNDFAFACMGAICVAGCILFLKKGEILSGTLSWSLLLCFALFPVGIGALVLDVPVTNDEEAYLLQADLFAAGDTVEKMSPAPEALFRRQVFEDATSGVRFSKYPPGTSLALAIGTWLGSPRFSIFLAAFLDLIFLIGICRALGIAKPGSVALLFAFAPFHLLVHTSFQSEVFTVPGILAGYWALLNLRKTQHSAWLLSAIVGAAAGWVFLCRPLTGVVFACACAPSLLFRRHGLGSIFGAILGGLPFLGLLLFWQFERTGDIWLSPYHLYAQAFGPWDAGLLQQGIRSPLDVYGNGDFFFGFLGQFAKWSVALGGILGAVGLGFWGLSRLRSRDGWAGLLLSIGLPLAYSFHWYPGHWGYLGPLYAFESLAFLTFGFVFILEQAPTRWARGLSCGALVWGLICFLSNLTALEAHSTWRAGPVSAAVEHAPRNAVILLPSSPEGMKNWVTSRWPFQDNEPVMIREQRNFVATMESLERLGLTNRPVFRFIPASGIVPLELVQRLDESSKSKE